MIRVWQWPSLGYSRPHGCEMWGWRWAPDTPETRREHPDGRAGSAQDAFGWEVSGSYRPQVSRGLT